VDDSSAPARLAAAVRGARHRRGWSRETLAHHSGLSWSAISQIETGRRADIRLSSLAALASALDISLDYLTDAHEPRGLMTHEACFYDSVEGLAECATTFIRDGLSHDYALLVVTAPATQRLIQVMLGSDEKSVVFRDASDWYTTPTDATRGYQGFVRDARAGGAPWAGVIGEPVWTGRSAPEVAAWTRYESIVNLAFAAWPVSLMCPYDVNALDPQVIADARRTHPELLEDGNRQSSDGYQRPETFITSV
jgi:transcriptional regulator with XRE-family HTH domain